MKNILWVLLMLAACSADVPRTVANGAPAPAFTARALDGHGLNFPADLRGKVVVLRFWADWCPYCGPEMRDIEPVYQRLKSRGLEVVALNAGQGPDAIAKFLRETPVSYPVLMDQTVQAVGLYGVVGLPYTYLIDRDGIVRGRIVGEATAEVFERQVTALLDRTSPPITTNGVHHGT